MRAKRYITFMMIPDGTENRREIRLRQWHFKMILSLLGAVVLGIILFFLLYGKILSRAARTDELEEENQRLLKYHYKVQLLEENLQQARDIVERLTAMAGVDIELPAMPDDSTLFAEIDKQQTSAVLNRGMGDQGIPSGLPLAGFVSQGFELTDKTHYHPGVDIACSEGTPVLATAAGRVIYAAFDSTYGYMVVLQHNDSVQSVYGHNSELLVSIGQKIPIGGRLALSGNTGKSTAPHLHYEIRINDQPIDPMEM